MKFRRGARRGGRLRTKRCGSLDPTSNMLRYLVTLIVLPVCMVSGFLIYRDLTSGPPIVLGAPAGVTVPAAETNAMANGWSRSSTIDLAVKAPPKTRV